jgi:DNA repair exonuclease SbcCD nuclease subunit
MFSFITIADPHDGLVRYSRDIGGIPERHLELMGSIGFAVEYAIVKKVQAVFFLGDLYNTNNPSQLFYSDIFPHLLRLSRAGISVYIIPGNHDAIQTVQGAHALMSIAKADIPNVYVIHHPVMVPFQLFNMLFLPHINKCMYSAEDLTESEYVAKVVDTELQKAEGPVVVFGHGTITGGVSGSERLIMRGGEQVFERPLSDRIIAYFMGHLHTRQSFPFGKAMVYYPGSMQACDFGERNDTKGFLHVTYMDDHTFDVQPVPVPTRPLVQFELNLKGFETQLKAVQEQLPANSIVKLVCRGPREKRHLFDEAAIHKAAKAAYWVEIEYDLEATAAARVAGLKDEQDPDVTFKRWYEAKGLPVEMLEQTLTAHRAVMAQVTSLKEDS